MSDSEQIRSLIYGLRRQLSTGKHTKGICGRCGDGSISGLDCVACIRMDLIAATGKASDVDALIQSIRNTNLIESRLLQ